MKAVFLRVIEAAVEENAVALRAAVRVGALQEAPHVVFADLGAGVLDSAMVEVAAYCLRKEARA